MPRTPSPLPAALLLPGLALLLAALIAYRQYIHAFPPYGLDLHVYTDGAKAYLDGKPVYDLGYTESKLPFTYPPIALLLFSPLPYLDHTATLRAILLLSVAAVAATAWLTLGMLGHRGTPGRIGAAAAVTALLIWCQPFQANAAQGQVNALLMLLVVADLATPNRWRSKGALIGIAAAVKLVPGIFIVYLLLTRRHRAAAVASTVFAALTALGWAAAPTASTDYWLHGLFLRSERVASAVGPRYLSNQSLHGVATRALGDTPTATALWLCAAAAITVAGLALAVRAHRHSEEAAAMVVVALTALLASPIAWSHHWIWITPALIVLTHAVTQLHGRAQLLGTALPIATIAAFLCWPIPDKPGGPLLARGFLWTAPRFHPNHTEQYSTTLEHLTGELYSLTALALLAAAALWLRTRRRTPPPPQPDIDAPAPAPAER